MSESLLAHIAAQDARIKGLEARHEIVDVLVCADCPFSDQDDGKWACFVDIDAPRDLWPRQASLGGQWLPPPSWCPLRAASRLVTLRAP